MKCFVSISNFLEEISSLSHSIVFLYFFALIAEEAFLSLLSILWDFAFKCLYLFFSPLLFTSLLFTAICKRQWRGRETRSIVSHKLALAMGTCRLLPQGLNQVLLQLLTLPHPLKGVQDGEQKWGTLCSGKTGWTGLQIVRYSQELILWAHFLYCLLSRKARTFCMVTIFSRD